MNLFSLFENEHTRRNRAHTVRDLFDRWTNSEYAPFNSDSGDHNEVIRKAASFLQDIVDPSQVERLAQKLSDYWHGEDGMELDEKLGSQLVNRRQAHALITKFKRHSFGEGDAAGSEGTGVFDVGDHVLFKGHSAEIIEVDGTAATIRVPNWKNVSGMVDDTTEVDPASHFLELAPHDDQGTGQQLNIQQLATISDEALDNAYHYGRSTPGNTFGWQANLASAAYAKQAIESGITNINQISDAVHKGWWSVAQKFVDDPDQFDDTETLRVKGKFDKKMADRIAQMVPFNQLTPDQQKIDTVVARALLQALKGQPGVAEGSMYSDEEVSWEKGGRRAPTGAFRNPAAEPMPVNKYIAQELDTLLKLAQDHVDDITNRSRGGYGNKKSGGLEDAIFELSGVSNGFHSSMAEGVAELQELNSGLPRIGNWIIRNLKKVGNRIDLPQLIKQEMVNNQGTGQQSVSEGKKVDRFVGYVEKSEEKAGKSKKDAESIAWATANKRGMLDNKNKKKVKEDSIANQITRDMQTMNQAFQSGQMKPKEFAPGEISLSQIYTHPKWRETIQAMNKKYPPDPTNQEVDQPSQIAAREAIKRMIQQGIKEDSTADQIARDSALIAQHMRQRWEAEQRANQPPTPAPAPAPVAPAAPPEVQVTPDQIANHPQYKTWYDRFYRKELPNSAHPGQAAGSAKQYTDSKIKSLIQQGTDPNDPGPTPGWVKNLPPAPAPAAPVANTKVADQPIYDNPADTQKAPPRKAAPAAPAPAGITKTAPPEWGNKSTGITKTAPPEWGNKSTGITKTAPPAETDAQRMNRPDMRESKNKPKSMKRAANDATGPKFGGYYKGTQKGAPRAVQGFGSMEEGIAGNMTVRSDTLTNLKKPEDLTMKTADPLKGNPNRNALVSAQARNLVAKGAQTAGPGTGSHQNKALDVKKGDFRKMKHKGSFDFSESTNFLAWAMASGYNVIGNPAVYESAKYEYNMLLAEVKKKVKEGVDPNAAAPAAAPATPPAPPPPTPDDNIPDLQPGQYFVWRVYFDDGTKTRMKITDPKFDVNKYYADKNISVINVDYNWKPRGKADAV